MKYQVVYGSSSKVYEAIEEIERKVKGLIEQGWKPQGGISISEADYKWYTVCQAMIKA